MKACTKCGEVKDFSAFWISNRNKSGREAQCIECRLSAKAVMRGADRERYNERNRVDRARLRAEVLEAYGNECACCGEKEPGFLTIDHVDGGGNKHRKEVHTNSILRWLKREGFPAGFQVLCFNCNQARAIYGVCPHQK